MTTLSYLRLVQFGFLTFLAFHTVAPEEYLVCHLHKIDKGIDLVDIL